MTGSTVVGKIDPDRRWASITVSFPATRAHAALVRLQRGAELYEVDLHGLNAIHDLLFLAVAGQENSLELAKELPNRDHAARLVSAFVQSRTTADWPKVLYALQLVIRYQNVSAEKLDLLMGVSQDLSRYASQYG